MFFHFPNEQFTFSFWPARPYHRSLFAVVCLFISAFLGDVVSHQLQKSFPLMTCRVCLFFPFVGLPDLDRLAWFHPLSIAVSLTSISLPALNGAS